ncbi:hypothetical protein L5515_002354 [Caenorhabditis briggsae]|uniref:F-box domain-containing protein n=1 Tax=Caenorhabditis briggsae TaxID=6238 RepID=A0AAE9J5K1_CAEBR|nr:hypothetical protein L5515_002354 [Caenorhabditis briggsae]
MPISYPRLPIIVQQEILTNMTPYDLFELSHCSKRCTELVPLAGTKEYQFLIDLPKLTVSIQALNFEQYTYSFDDILPGVIPAQNPKLQLKTFLLKLFDVFRSQHIRSFNTDTNDFDNFASIANILIERECIISSLNFQIEQVREAELQKILESLQISSCLNFAKSVSLSSTFECKLAQFPKEMYIENSCWFGFDQLCSAVNSSVKIELSNSSLVVRHINSFLEKWMAGKFKDMTTFFISIHSSNFYIKGQVLGMQLPIRSGEFSIHRRYLDRHCGRVADGIVVENVNGVRAVMHFDSISTNCFNFMVLA